MRSFLSTPSHLFLTVLVLVFPLLFIAVLESFYTIAHSNLHTIETYTATPATTTAFVVPPTELESLLQKRKQDAYLLLSLFFVLLLLMIYWMYRQTNWNHKHDQVADNLQSYATTSHQSLSDVRSVLSSIHGYARLLADSDSVNQHDMRYVHNIQDLSEQLQLQTDKHLETTRKHHDGKPD